MPIPKIVSVAIPLTFLIFTGINSCKSPTEPCTDCGEKKPPTVPDTTSHDFTWKTETLGDAGSVAYDVAMVNDTSIWVVGSFYKSKARIDGEDSLYNAAHWNGKYWKYIQVPIRLEYENGFVIITKEITIRSIFKTPDHHLFVSSDAGGLSIFSQNEWKTLNMPPSVNVAASQVWGSTSSDLYMIGSLGRITHYNGSSFTKMETGTDVALTDIYGTPDGKEVWACGNTFFGGAGNNSILLRKSKNGSWEKLYELAAKDTNTLYDSFLSTLWTAGNGEFLVAGRFAQGLVRHSYLDFTKQKVENFARKNYAFRMRGSNSNNVFMVGDFAMIWHYNGSTWKYYEEAFSAADWLNSVSVSETKMVAVGDRHTDILGSALIITATKK